VLSWAQLGLHNKPCGLLNVCAYYRHLVQFMDYAVEQDFLKPKHRALLIVEQEPGVLLDRFEELIVTQPPKPFDRSQT
jgi:predicted Rossmann-fold nucleotide-binding protein